MAEFQRIAPSGSRSKDDLSADNTLPDRRVVLDLLRQAAPKLGLKPPVLATLETMICCLPPKRTHNTVFASNATLTARLGGLSDRTLRRHFATLEEVGLLARQDSPNGKRFVRRNPRTGATLRFGFDLSPLFAKIRDLCVMAKAATEEREEMAYLRSRLRAALQAHLAGQPDDPTAQEALRALRRKMTIDGLREMLDQFRDCRDAEPTAPTRDTPPSQVSAKDGQIVRHQKNEKKESIERKNDASVSVQDLVAACPDTASFAEKRIETVSDVIAHAERIAPMAGIDAETYRQAAMRLGRLKAAVTVWAVLQMQDRIRKIGAYFRTLTTGPDSDGFNPFALIRRLGKRMHQVSCPRTMSA